MKHEALKKIEKYSKAEIIAAIERQPFIWGQILHELEQNKELAIFEKADKARQKEIECLHNLSKWKAEVIKKYGDGNAVKLSDLPLEEIEKGADLERALKESIEASQKANAAENKLTRKYLQNEEPEK